MFICDEDISRTAEDCQYYKILHNYEIKYII